MVKHTKTPETTNPKKRRATSRDWLYEQVADIHRDGLSIFDAAVVAQPPYGKKLTAQEQLDLLGQLESVDDLSADDVARAVQARFDYLRYIVATAADLNAVDLRQRRVPTEQLVPLLRTAAQRHEGALSFTTWLSGEADIAAHTARRICRGAQKTLKPAQLERILDAIGAQHHLDELDPVSDEAKAVDRREELDEALRPIIRVLTAAAIRGDGDYTPTELQAIADWRWMHAGDWPETIVPLFTRPVDRDAILVNQFRKEHDDRDPEELPRRLRNRALKVLRSRQRREREDLKHAQHAVGRWPINDTRVYELTRGARRAGYLPEKSKPRGYSNAQPKQ